MEGGRVGGGLGIFHVPTSVKLKLPGHLGPVPADVWASDGVLPPLRGERNTGCAHQGGMESLWL